MRCAGVSDPLTAGLVLDRGRNYLAEANDNIAVVAMIETRQAIDNLDAIVRVPGLDGVFIGTCARSSDACPHPPLRPGLVPLLQAPMTWR
jgi:2-keto-3-deoxy-L-rhamnonate aldolase RhmA